MSTGNSRFGRSAAPLARQRIDKWLWHARLMRTRSAAASLAAAGYVRVNGQRIHAPSRPVRVGDVVTVPLGGSVQVLRVLGFASRRGSAEDAQRLCEPLEPGRAGELETSKAPSQRRTGSDC